MKGALVERRSERAKYMSNSALFFKNVLAKKDTNQENKFLQKGLMASSLLVKTCILFKS